MSNPGTRSSNSPQVWFLVALSAIAMPLGVTLDGAAQWIFLFAGIGALFLCANQIRLNNQRNRQR
jgi:hypothetical protein